jgi:hypothetical protein
MTAAEFEEHFVPDDGIANAYHRRGKIYAKQVQRNVTTLQKNGSGLVRPGEFLCQNQSDGNQFKFSAEDFHSHYERCIVANNSIEHSLAGVAVDGEASLQASNINRLAELARLDLVDDQVLLQAKIAQLMAEIDSLAFDTLALHAVTNGKPLLHVGLHLFERHDAIESIGTNEETVRRFFRELEASYLPNPCKYIYIKMYVFDPVEQPVD